MIGEDKSSWLRPSMLPKLALCAHYRSEEDAGEAAARGTKLDVAFRGLLAGENVDASNLDGEEREAVRWAVDTARALSGGHHVESNEERLKIALFGMTGTADALCLGAQWSADLKTGQRRNYVEQQAAYALGFMEESFADEWIVYLLYCDLQEVDTLRFTRAQAEQIVRGALANANSGEPPVTNEYCGWCAKRFECPARKEALGIIPLDELKTIDLNEVDSAKLREFALCCDVIEDHGSKAREILKERIIGGEKVPGVSLVSKRGARKLGAEKLAPLVDKIGAAKVLATFGTLSESKAQELWIGSQIEVPFPAAAVEEMPGSSYVRVGKPKAAKS